MTDPHDCTEVVFRITDVVPDSEVFRVEEIVVRIPRYSSSLAPRYINLFLLYDTIAG